MSPAPLRIAHIDDDADLRAMVSLAFRLTVPCTLVSCESGEAAQRLLPDFAPDVILVDMQMPGGMDGVETLKALEASMDLSAVSVVFASGTDDPRELHRIRESRADGIISKPFDAFRLAEQINRIHSS